MKVSYFERWSVERGLAQTKTVLTGIMQVFDTVLLDQIWQLAASLFLM